jgi:uncharacterized protein YcbK (DUF882 family)
VILCCDPLQNAIANGDTRTLSLSHTHREDDITVTFKRNGRYDDDALKKLNWFLRDWRTDDTIAMDPQLFDILWEVHREVGAKEPIHIVSSYRSPHTNGMLRRRGRGVAQHSLHMHGKAIDFHIPGVSLDDLRAAGLRLQRGGVGFYPSLGSPFVHLDTGSVRHWPRMTHDQLVKVFPNGRTVHVPSDGNPLAGYALALADIEKRGRIPSRSVVATRDGDVMAVEPRTKVASNSKRGLLARLLGIGKDEEEDEEEAATPNSAPVAVARAPAAPIPVPRPRTAEFALASTASTPVDLAPRRRPAELAEAQTIPGATGPVAQRFVWSTGPQAQAAPETRPPARNADTTASVPRWPLNETPNDRVPSDVALAYAAQAAPDAVRPATAPMTIPRAALTATTQIARTPNPPARPGQRYNDPWLRGITITPSIHFSMKVTVYGTLNMDSWRVLMHKPVTSLAMTFTADPYEGMTSVQFGGAAVTFLPTVTFSRRTASLN